MHLSGLCVVHQPKQQRSLSVSCANPSTIKLAEDPNKTFFVETCQRKLWISNCHRLAETSPRGNQVKGWRAYAFLLRVLTGLESVLTAETNVFGQFKASWKQFETTHTPLAKDLNPWFQKLFRDAKDIRTEFLQGVGGASYGRLVRRFIQPQPNETILFVGAGQLTHSIIPFLLEQNIWVWNRTPERVDDLKKTLARHTKALRLKKVLTADEERKAWKTASWVVVCTPLDDHRDTHRVELLKSLESSKHPSPKILHLGCLDRDCGSWKKVRGFFTLDALFRLQKEQDRVCSLQIVRAHKACRERALLRSMGEALSVRHGWEDLALFA